ALSFPVAITRSGALFAAELGPNSVGMVRASDGVVQAREAPSSGPDVGGLAALAFSPDGALLAVADRYRRSAGLRLLRTSDGSLARGVDAPGPGDVVFSPDGLSLAILTNDHVTLMRVADG